MKKFYKLVTVAQGGAGQDKTGYVIHLDGKPVQTPSRVPLCAPNKALAEAIAAEWTAQGEKIDPETMPLTQILTTAQDHVVRERAGITAKMLQYLDTDLLCYRAELPQDLAERQAACWDEWLGWFERTYGSALITTTALQALTQPEAAQRAVADTVAALDDMRFCVLQLVTMLTGSLVLGLAFTAAEASPEQVFNAANIEENYKYQIYNEAEHGTAPQQEKTQRAMQRDLEAARLFRDSLA